MELIDQIAKEIENNSRQIFLEKYCKPTFKENKKIDYISVFLRKKYIDMDYECDIIHWTKNEIEEILLFVKTNIKENNKYYIYDFQSDLDAEFQSAKNYSKYDDVNSQQIIGQSINLDNFFISRNLELYEFKPVYKNKKKNKIIDITFDKMVEQ